MRLLPRSTFGLVLLVSLVLASATLLVGTIIFETTHEALEVQLNHRIEAETNALLAVHEEGGLPALAVAIGRREIEGSETGMGYRLVDSAGNRLAGKLRSRMPEPGWKEMLRIGGRRGGRDVSQALTTALPDGGRLLVAADRDPIEEADRVLLRTFAVNFGVMLMLGVGGAWALGTVVRLRMERINATAQAIIGGDLTRRVPRDGSSSEFDRLSETLNKMLDRNAELLENLQQVSSDIAHDLRTPLSRMHYLLEDALAKPSDAEGYRIAIEAATVRSRELLELFSALLRISEIETWKVRESFQSVDLTAVVEQVGEAFRPDLEASGHKLLVAAEPGVALSGERRLLSQLLVNLIENAMRHTPAGSTVTLSLRQRPEGIELAVLDDGPGIAVQDREVVLRRFARLEQSRSTPGHGLGLSLVAAIAHAHFATLTLVDNAPGLGVIVTFPRPVAP